MRAITIVILTTSVLFAEGTVYGQSNWQNVDVAASGKNESAPDVAVEVGGTAHIVFKMVSGKVKGDDVYDIGYANTIGNTLSSPQQVTSIATSFIGDVSIDLDASNNVHVAFGRSGSGSYFNNMSGNFANPIQFTNQTPRDLHMDIDDNGKAHIVFFDVVAGILHIFYATNGSGSFVVTDLGNFGFDKGALFPTVDEKNGVVHIAFKGAFTTPTEDFYQNIYLIDNSSGTFPTSKPTLVADTGPFDQEPTISVDSQGIVHIVFDISAVLGIRHAENSSGSFQTEVVAGAGVFGTSHALGPNDEIGIALGINQSSGLIFTTNKTGFWISEPITPEGNGDKITTNQGGIAIDGSGFVHVVGTNKRGNNGKPNNDVRYHTNNPNFSSGGEPGVGELHVAQIDMSAKKKGPRWNAVAAVTIHDGQHELVSGATVSGHWIGLVVGSGSATTDANGVATLNSPKTKNSGEITFIVDELAKDGFAYKPAANEVIPPSASITGPPASKVSARESGLPTEFALFGNYPNPFNPETSIWFALPEASHAEITIYNTRGQVILQLVNTGYVAGEHSVSWDGTDQSGNPVSSGVYLYRLQAGDFSRVRKMSLLR